MFYVLCFTFLFLPLTVFADDLTDSMGSLYAKFPLGGFTSDGTNVTFNDDFYTKYPSYVVNGVKTPPSQSDVAGWKAAYQSLPQVQARQIAAITAQAQNLLSGYMLYFGQARWTTYQTALNTAVANATTAINAMTDIASVKNYQVTWPAAP